MNVTAVKIEFTHEERSILLNVAENVFHNVQWDKEDARWKEDYQSFIINLEAYEYELLNRAIEKLGKRP